MQRGTKKMVRNSRSPRDVVPENVVPGGMVPGDVVPGGVIPGSAALISEASLIRLPLYLRSEQTIEFLFMWSYLSIFSAVKSEKK